MCDPLVSLASSQEPAVQEWLQQISPAENLLTEVLQVVHPEFHDACSQVLSRLQLNTTLKEAAESWPAIFEAMELIVNRVTPWHQDQGGCPEVYDCLLNLGNCQEARFLISDFGVISPYSPGSVIYLTGRVLRHSVKEWEKGREQAVIAHFTKDAVQNRLEVNHPQLPTIHQYLV
ncbi:hypothetical protein BS17DRAFT_849507 [Gyrodon lividus]|nr:hypothetical protein BS17DRAFT_849507 [Gyrodon lividus]